MDIPAVSIKDRINIPSPPLIPLSLFKERGKQGVGLVVAQEPKAPEMMFTLGNQDKWKPQGFLYKASYLAFEKIF
jgi:hypothetical protein